MIMKNDWVKFLILLCIMCNLLLFMDIPVLAEENELKTFRVHVTDEANGYTYAVNWWQKQEAPRENEYYITLPHFAKEQHLSAEFICSGDVFLNGKKIVSGSKIGVLPEGENSIQCSEKQYSLYVLYGSDIPTIHITTEAGNLDKVYEDKSYKEPGYAVILDGDGIAYEGELEYIKGRGNSTWENFVKKPFNIKFKEKVNLFEMGQAKKWCLLANSLDDTLLRSKLVSDLANTVGIHFSAQSVIVDLYVDQEYIGNYTLMESVEIGTSRVNITDLEELNEIANPDVDFKTLPLAGVRGEESYAKNGSYKWVELPRTLNVISGGYLIEYELASRYDDEVSGFVSVYGQPVILKSPEYASKEQVEYISGYYQDFEDAARNSDGYNERGKHYSKYIDVESMAKMYIFQEYLKNLDAGLTSFYYYKDVDGKLVAAPAWDFDSAFGRRYKRDDVKMYEPTGIWAATGKLHNELENKSTILSIMCRHVEFRELAQKQWKEYFEPNVEELLNELDGLYGECQASMIADKCKWKDAGDYAQTAEFVDAGVYTLRKFIIERSAFMTETFSEDKCYIGYQANGGEGGMYDLEIYDKGSVIPTMPNAFTNGDKEFLGWNTKANGFGESYENGAEITLTENVILYAQWKQDGIKGRIQSIMKGLFR